MTLTAENTKLPPSLKNHQRDCIAQFLYQLHPLAKNTRASQKKRDAAFHQLIQLERVSNIKELPLFQEVVYWSSKALNIHSYSSLKRISAFDLHHSLSMTDLLEELLLTMIFEMAIHKSLSEDTVAKIEAMKNFYGHGRLYRGIIAQHQEDYHLCSDYIDAVVLGKSEHTKQIDSLSKFLLTAVQSFKLPTDQEGSHFNVNLPSVNHYNTLGIKAVNMSQGYHTVPWSFQVQDIDILMNFEMDSIGLKNKPSFVKTATGDYSNQQHFYLVDNQQKPYWISQHVRDDNSFCIEITHKGTQTVYVVFYLVGGLSKIAETPINCISELGQSFSGESILHLENGYCIQHEGFSDVHYRRVKSINNFWGADTLVALECKNGKQSIIFK